MEKGFQQGHFVTFQEILFFTEQSDCTTCTIPFDLPQMDNMTSIVRAFRNSKLERRLDQRLTDARKPSVELWLKRLAHSLANFQPFLTAVGLVQSRKCEGIAAI